MPRGRLHVVTSAVVLRRVEPGDGSATAVARWLAANPCLVGTAPAKVAGTLPKPSPAEQPAVIPAPGATTARAAAAAAPKKPEAERSPAGLRLILLPVSPLPADDAPSVLEPGPDEPERDVEPAKPTVVRLMVGDRIVRKEEEEEPQRAFPVPDDVTAPRRRNLRRPTAIALLAAAGAGAVVWQLGFDPTPETRTAPAAREFKGEAWLKDLVDAGRAVPGGGSTATQNAAADKQVPEATRSTPAAQPERKPAAEPVVRTRTVSPGTPTTPLSPAPTTSPPPRAPTAEQAATVQAAISRALEQIAAARATAAPGSPEATALAQQEALVLEIAARYGVKVVSTTN